MIAAALFVTFAVLLLIGAPIAVCLGASSMLTMLIQGAGRPLDAVMSSLPMIVSASTSKFVLLAIPFFILAGNIMEKAGISEKLIRLAETCVGHRKGGIAIVCVIVSCFFAAISGSGPATVAALGVILVPAMIKSGYSPSFSAALMAASGAIGVIIPPLHYLRRIWFDRGYFHRQSVHRRTSARNPDGCSICHHCTADWPKIRVEAITEDQW